MKKIISILLICSMLLLSGCGADTKLYASYDDDDSIVNTDIGEYIIGQTAPLLTESKVCYFDDTVSMEDENLDCNAAILINVTDNQLMFTYQPFKKAYPASVTKLLTALVVLKNANMDDIVTIKEDDCGIVEEGAQLIGFRKGDQVTVKNLLYCLLVYSGNDSAIALAEYISGDVASFCDLLNKEAKRICCSGTHYINPHGLHDDDHYTTIYDEYLVLEECMKYDAFREISKVVDYEFNYNTIDGTIASKSFSTTNKFKLGIYPIPEGITILGGKTGNTYAAGTCLIMYVADAEGKEYVVGVFGAKSPDMLYTQMTYLMEKIVNNE